MNFKEANMVKALIFLAGAAIGALLLFVTIIAWLLT